MSALEMTPNVREHSRSLLAAMILELRADRRALSDEIDHAVSQLRNDLAGKSWSDGKHVVSFLPGRWVGVPKRRIGNALAFRRMQLDPYMSVKLKAKAASVVKLEQKAVTGGEQ